MEGGSRRKFLLGMASSSTAAVAGCGDLNFGASRQSGGGENRFSGVVIDAHGEPVQNAAVRVLGPDQGIEQPLGVGRSSVDGSFTVNYERRPEMLVLATKGRWFKPNINLSPADLTKISEIQLDFQRIDGPRIIKGDDGTAFGTLSVWRHVDVSESREVIRIEIVTTQASEPLWKDLSKGQVLSRGAALVSVPESAVIDYSSQVLYHVDGGLANVENSVEKFHPVRTNVPARAFLIPNILNTHERRQFKRNQLIAETVVGAVPYIGGFINLVQAIQSPLWDEQNPEPDIILGDTGLSSTDSNTYDSVSNGWDKPGMAASFEVPIRYPEPPSEPSRVHLSVDSGGSRIRYEQEFDAHIGGKETDSGGGTGEKRGSGSVSFVDKFNTPNTGYDPEKWSVYRNQYLEGGFAERVGESGLRIGNSNGVLALYTNTTFEPPTLVTFDVGSWSPAYGSGHYMGWVEDGYNTNERPGSVRKQTSDSVVIDFNTNRGDPYVELLSQSGDGVAAFGGGNGNREETARFLKPADDHGLFSGEAATTFELAWRNQSVIARMDGSEVAQLSNYVPSKSMPLYVITHDWTGGNPEMTLNSIQVNSLE